MYLLSLQPMRQSAVVYQPAGTGHNLAHGGFLLKPAPVPTFEPAIPYEVMNIYDMLLTRTNLATNPLFVVL